MKTLNIKFKNLCTLAPDKLRTQKFEIFHRISLQRNKLSRLAIST
jgi:hypothetical protein